MPKGNGKDKIKIVLDYNKSTMKFDGFPGEKEILSFKLANGVGWLTTHRLIIQQEKRNPRFNIVERQEPEMFLLSDFTEAQINGEEITANFKSAQKAALQLLVYSPSLLEEIKAYIEEAAKYCKKPSLS